MSYKLSKITPSTTGVKTWTTGFAAAAFRLKVIPSPGAASPIVFESDGSTDGTSHYCDTKTVETTRIYQERFTDRIASIFEWNGTAWVETLKVQFDSFTATEVKYNIITANSGYQLCREAWS